MLRGTNRSVIEINSTDSKYFEKIIFFIKPEYHTVPKYILKNEAESTAEKLGKNFYKKKKTAFKKTPLMIGIAFAVLAVLFFILK